VAITKVLVCGDPTTRRARNAESPHRARIYSCWQRPNLWIGSHYPQYPERRGGEDANESDAVGSERIADEELVARDAALLIPRNSPGTRLVRSRSVKSGTVRHQTPTYLAPYPSHSSCLLSLSMFHERSITTPLLLGDRQLVEARRVLARTLALKSEASIDPHALKLIEKSFILCVLHS
jgi:hypothetical protein